MSKKERGFGICACCDTTITNLHVYIVENRGKPLSGKKFCSVDCTVSHVAMGANGMEVEAENFELTPGQLCVHKLKIGSKNKRKRHQPPNSLFASS